MGQNMSSVEYRQEKLENCEVSEKENVFNSHEGKSASKLMKDDPRSPSQEIDRTPLRGSQKPQRKIGEYRKLVNDFDPRSPCGEINRTPIKGVSARDGDIGQAHPGQRLFTNDDSA